MLESYFRIVFVYDDGGEAAFPAAIEFLDEEDTPGYSRRSERRVTLKDELLNCGLKVREADRHQFTYDDSVVVLTVPCENLTLTTDGAERLDDALSFVPRLAQATAAQYVFGMHDWRAERISSSGGQTLPSPISSATVDDGRIAHPTWLMLFPPTLVPTYGRDWLLGLPVERAEELANGAILLVATEAITDCDSDTEIAEVVNQAMEPVEAAFAER